MSTKIRLARAGAKRRPYYRIVVADSRMPRDGRYIEKVGTYNPMLPKEHEDRVRIDADKIKDWLGKGAQATDRVARLLSQQGVMDAPERREQTKKNQPGQKAQERVKEKAEKAAEAADAAAEAAAEPAAE